MAKIFIQTYGCALNSSDSNEMAIALQKAGHHIVKKENNADAIVLNSCAVKDATEKKEILKIQQLSSKKVPLVIAGCMNYNKKLLKKIAPNAVLLGTYSKGKIAHAVNSAIQGNAKEYFEKDENEKGPNSTAIVEGVVAKIAIGQGCTENCAYCATKLARPFLQSSPPRIILQKIEDALKKSAMEIQLAGMDTGAYGLEMQTNLAELLGIVGKSMEAKNSKAMVRVGMLNPIHIKRIGNTLFDCFKQRNFYKFFHIPVQSGSNAVLKIMKRNYEIDDFFSFKKEIEKRFGDFSLSTDIIIGHPGETESDFEETLNFMKTAKLSMMNLSKFSSRPFTMSSRMKQVASKKIKERASFAYGLYKKIALFENKKQVGKTLEALFTEQKGNLSRGKTASYKQVSVECDDGKISLGNWARVKIKGATHTTLIGEIADG